MKIYTIVKYTITSEYYSQIYYHFRLESKRYKNPETESFEFRPIWKAFAFAAFAYFILFIQMEHFYEEHETAQQHGHTYDYQGPIFIDFFSYSSFPLEGKF